MSVLTRSGHNNLMTRFPFSERSSRVGYRDLEAMPALGGMIVAPESLASKFRLDEQREGDFVMAIPFTNAVVSKLAGTHDIVLEADNAEYTKSNDAVSVILFAPLRPQHGGPIPSKLPLYNVTGTQGNQSVQIQNVRYVGQTPNGNAAFTTE